MRNPPLAVSSTLLSGIADIDQPRGPLDILLHQVDEVGAAGNEFR